MYDVSYIINLVNRFLLVILIRFYWCVVMDCMCYLFSILLIYVLISGFVLFFMEKWKDIGILVKL